MTDALEVTAEKISRRKSTDTIGRAGEHYVAAELNRRGVYASPFSGNLPGIDIVATDYKRERMAYVQVKTKLKAGNWHMSQGHGWEIDRRNLSCLCLGTCEPGACKGNHDHHPDAVDLRQLREIPGKTDHYWAFVPLGDVEGLATLLYWIVPDEEVRRLIRESFKSYLAKHGGHRPGKVHHSLHAMITETQLEPWKGKWEKLGLALFNLGGPQ